MPIPADQTLVRGDVILVRAVVEFAGHNDPNLIFAKVEGYGEDVMARRESADLAETLIAVGDEVTLADAEGEEDLRGIVRALDGEDVWVRWSSALAAAPVVDRCLLMRTRTADEVAAAARASSPFLEAAE
ncbi:hypothetical protein [Methylobacterium nodulans]|uniref:Uncharacterized protein n=1 Tax=Methylobacterium nodulans (strain LMG 21967 / CNCM I-2342 / ORS 2060) TaxID=460265 RepID=B8IV53_METNO|nr:hypothetical protein [Methylobacterium nodulans]ACL59111.1 conserved hypothetical protein [Methylobacterium nodulans ORS 2060]